MRVSLAVLGTLCFGLILGCGGGGGGKSATGGTSSGGTGVVALEANAVVLQGTATAQLDGQSGLLTLDDASAASIGVGSVVASQTGSGFLRRVSGVVSARSGEKTFQTEEADLDDLLREAFFDAATTVSGDRGEFFAEDGSVTRGRGGRAGEPYKFSNLKIADGVTMNGELGFDLRTEFLLNLGIRGLDELKFGVNLDATASIQLKVDRAIPLPKLPRKLFEWRGPAWRPHPLVQVVPMITFKQHVQFSPVGKLELSATPSLQAGATATYKGGNWERSATKSFTVPVSASGTLTAAGNIDVSVLDAQVTLLIYGVAGPYANVRLLGFEGEVTPRADCWNLNLKRVHNLSFGVQGEILKKITIRKDFGELVSDRTQVGDYLIACPPTGGTSGGGTSSGGTSGGSSGGGTSGGGTSGGSTGGGTSGGGTSGGSSGGGTSGGGTSGGSSGGGGGVPASHYEVWRGGGEALNKAVAWAAQSFIANSDKISQVHFNAGGPSGNPDWADSATLYLYSDAQMKDQHRLGAGFVGDIIDFGPTVVRLDAPVGLVPGRRYWVQIHSGDGKPILLYASRFGSDYSDGVSYWHPYGGNTSVDSNADLNLRILRE